MSYSYDPISTFCGNVVGWFIGRGPPREGPSLHEGRPTMVVMGFRPIPDANTNIYMYIYIYGRCRKKRTSGSIYHTYTARNVSETLQYSDKVFLVPFCKGNVPGTHCSISGPVGLGTIFDRTSEAPVSTSGETRHRKPPQTAEPCTRTVISC